MAPPTVLASLCHQPQAPLFLLLLLLALQLCSAPAAVCTSASGVEQHEAAACTPSVQPPLVACSSSACISQPLLLQSAAAAALLLPNAAAACREAPRCSDAALLSPGLGVDLLLCRQHAPAAATGDCRCMFAAAPAWYTRRALSVFCTSGHRPFLMPRLASLKQQSLRRQQAYNCQLGAA
jgi:hypothetical protein